VSPHRGKAEPDNHHRRAKRLSAIASVATAHSTVIVRLDRTIQYAKASAKDQMSRGVLDTRLRGYDSGVWARFLDDFGMMEFYR